MEMSITLTTFITVAVDPAIRVESCPAARKELSKLPQLNGAKAFSHQVVMAKPALRLLVHAVEELALRKNARFIAHKAAIEYTWPRFAVVGAAVYPFQSVRYSDGHTE